MSDTANLGGNWEGAYQYSSAPDAGDFPFKARLLVKDDALTGIIVEENLRLQGRSQADLTGTLAGRTVAFTKSYRDTSGGYSNPVEYRGELSADGQTISGTWTLPHDSGTFTMTRAG